MDTYTTSNRDIMEFDLDRTYNNKVKALHADILEFISKAQTQLPPDFASRLFELREASLAVITSVKEIKHLRKNISIYIRSDNEYIRREYNKLRAQIAGVMREIELLEKSPEEDRDIFTLDEFKVAIDEENVIATGTMDSLIREEKITAAMATSLMNDLGYARNAIWQLADVAQALFGTKDSLSKEAEDMVALTQEDIDDMREEEPQT